MEEVKVYEKVCVYCGLSYQSTSRGKRYCSDKCCEEANAKNKALKKKRAKRNKQRKEHEMENRLATRAYSMCNFIAEQFKIKQCNCDNCKGENINNELHHKDMNIFNNDPNNIINFCNRTHKIVHNHLPDVNTVTVLSKCLDTENPIEEYNLLLKEIWEQWLASKGIDKTKEEYLEWLYSNIDNLIKGEDINA